MANKFAVLHKAALVAAVAFMLATALGRVSASNITCEQVTNWLMPCIGYGVFGGTVPPECCKGLKELIAAKHTQEDRRVSCHCIQDGAAKIPGIDYDRINNLPGLCGTSIPYKIYPSTNCSRFV